MALNGDAKARASRRHERTLSGMFKRLKCVLIGDQCTRKTSLVVQYTLGEEKTCRTDRGTADAFDNYNANVKIDQIFVEIDLWDVADNPDTADIRSLCYPGTEIFLLFFNSIEPQSAENLRNKWAPEILLHNPTAPWVIVATNVDERADYLSAGEPIVTQEEGATLAEGLGSPAYIELERGQCAQDLFEKAMRIALHSQYTGLKKRAKFVEGILTEFSNRLESNVDALNLAVWRGNAGGDTAEMQGVTALRESVDKWTRVLDTVKEASKQDPEASGELSCVVQ